MALTYRCKQGDMLDWICWKHYGYSSGAVIKVLEANPGLADKGPVYNAGLEIILPELPDNDIAADAVRLWE